MRSALTIWLTNSWQATSVPPHDAASIEELPPIRDGAWAAWARRSPAASAILASNFECKLPDGRLGVVTAVFEDGAWRLACQMA